MSSYNNLLFAKEGAVGIITINRPQALNALNSAILRELDDLLGKIAGDSAVKAVIICGAGEKAFIAGADINEMIGMSPVEAREFALLGHRTMNRIASMGAVTIAGINGYALGGGCELAMACDIRVASTNTRMGIPEVSLGVIPGFGGTQRLARLVGQGIAMELLATGRQCKAEECKAIGLVNTVVEPEHLMDHCMKLAERICKNSASAISFGKQCISSGLQMDLTKGLELEISAFALTFSTDDQKEGMQAFLEKRETAFQ